MISNTSSSHAYPVPAMALQGNSTKFRFRVPVSIATNKPLLKELRDGIERMLKQNAQKTPFLSVTVTKSKPHRIKLHSPVNAMYQQPGTRDHAYDRTLEICRGIDTLVCQFGFPADLAVDLADSVIDWPTVTDALDQLLQDPSTPEEALAVVLGAAELLRHLGREIHRKPDAAKGMTAVLDLLERLPGDLRNQTVMFVANEDMLWPLESVLIHGRPEQVDRLRLMLAQAMQAQLTHGQLDSSDAQRLKALCGTAKVDVATPLSKLPPTPARQPLPSARRRADSSSS